MEIPYTSMPRQDTGIYNAKLGLWLFLAAEIMFFGALYSSYAFLRVANPAWAGASAALPVHHSFLNALCLAGAALCSAQAWAELRVDRGRPPGPWLSASVVFGLFSILLVSLEHRALAAQGISAATSNFFGLYYVLTSLVRFHVLVVVVIGGYHLLFMRRQLLRNTAGYTHRLECLGLFWQFLALQWAVIVLLFYVF